MKISERTGQADAATGGGHVAGKSGPAEQELDYAIVEAAAKLVARGGWSALSTRTVATLVGTSRNTISTRFKGSLLHQSVIRRAYSELIVALAPLEPQVERGARVEPALILDQIIHYLREDDEAAPLMAQVVALAAAREHEFADEFQLSISVNRLTLEKILSELLGTLCPSQPCMSERAGPIIEWYVAACVSLVLNRKIDGAELVKLSEGYRCLA